MEFLRGNARWQRLVLFLRSGHRSFIFSFVIFLLSLGFGCGVETSSAMLISRVGTAPLFYVYVGSSFLTLTLAGCVYLLVDRFPRKRVIFAVYEGFALGIFLLWSYLLKEPSALWPYYVARICFYSIFMLTSLQFWLLASDVFTNLEAKLRYPVFVASAVFGTLGGSLLIQEFAKKIGAVNFYPIWATVLALSPLLLSLVRERSGPSRAKQKNEADPLPELPTEDYPKSISRLVALLFFFWLAYTFFSYGVDYFFNKAALQSLPDENALTAFFGRVGFVSLSAVLLYQIFLAERLNRLLGVNQLVSLVAVLLLLGTGVAYFFPKLSSVAFAEGLLVFFIDFAAVTFLEPVSSIFPDKFRGRMKVLIDGFGRPAGSILLLLFALTVSWKWKMEKINAPFFGAVILFLLYPYFFRKAYLRYLLDCLVCQDKNVVLNAVQALGERGQSFAAQDLLQLLERTDSIPVKKNIVLSLGKIRSEAALPKVIEQFHVPDESLQLAVLESLSLYRNYDSLFALFEIIRSQENVSFQVRMNATYLMTKLVGKRMIPLLVEALSEDNLRIQANALESLALLKAPETIPLALPYLQHESRRLRANAAILLHAFAQTRAKAKGSIDELFTSRDPLTQLSAIYAIGELELRQFLKPLLDLMKNPDPRYQRNILAALAKMSIPKYCENFASLLLDPEEELAMEAVQRLGRFPKHSRWLVFEKISQFQTQDLQTAVHRLDQSPLDFSEELELFSSSNRITAPHPL